MDAKLMAWARAVKARTGARHPVLWLFSDPRRLPDPTPALRRLPPRLAGLVYRPARLDAASLALGRRLRALCRARGVMMVAAPVPLARALGVPPHLRTRGAAPPRTRCRFATASAHDAPGLRAARRAGATLVFLGPVFATASHPGAPSLGTRRFARLLAAAPLPVLALGGVTGARARALPRSCRGAGVIGALHPG
jgi:thiamine-phosphate pyrophosphorylase